MLTRLCGEAMRGRGRSRIAARFGALNKLFERLDECFPHVRPPSENMKARVRKNPRRQGSVTSVDRDQSKRRLRAAIYVTAAATSTHMPAINPAQAVAMGNRRSRRGVEWHRYRIVCFSSGGASVASRSALRSAAFSSFFLCFSSVRARAALCRSARSRR